ncbi:hypothetical protein TUM22923_02670 [Polynucleobacter sp. TUM22923]|jgi:hypothetical protein|nr:hypothetical protein TUM22923_02670 [Polynucleobacter sp. TUM22923]
MSTGSTVDMKRVNARFMVKPVSKASYTLGELLAQCNAGEVRLMSPMCTIRPIEDILWLKIHLVGNEII